MKRDSSYLFLEDKNLRKKNYSEALDLILIQLF